MDVSARVRRWARRTSRARMWAATNIAGVTVIAIRASCQFSSSIAARIPTSVISSLTLPSTPSLSASPIASTSDAIRLISRPVIWRSKNRTESRW